MSETNPADSEKDITIPPLVFPKFEAHIKQDDFEHFIKDNKIGDFTQRDQRLLFSFSILEQRLSFISERLELLNGFLQVMATQINNQRRAQREIKWTWKIAIGVIGVVGAGFISAVFRKFIG